MKDYTEFTDFIFRTCSLPFDSLELLLLDEESLIQSLYNSQIQEAIYLASPELYSELQKMLNKKIRDRKNVDSLLFPLVRYISRMSTRCTPFGLFAGCGFGQIGFETNIILEESINRKTRLDMHFLSTLYDVIIKIPKVKRAIKYYPNTSLYPIEKKYRYIEQLQTHGAPKYQIAEVKQCYYLKKVLRVAKGGVSIKTLSTNLVNEDISHENILEFINELIDAQVIVGELSQAITGKDYFTRIIALLDRVASDVKILTPLKKIYSLLEKLDSGQDDNTKLYEHIVTLIERTKIPYTEKFLFQVDLFRNTSSASLGNNVLNELKSAITFLNKITPLQENDLIYQFRQDFYNRYEGKEVPLMEALDIELGIGYPSKANIGDTSPLVDNFYIPQETEQQVNRITSFQALLLKKIISGRAQNNMEIELTDEDVKNHPQNWDNLPLTIITMFKLFQADEENILLKIESCGGSSAANLLARFTHIDETIEKFVNEITKKEQEVVKEAILAEIVHTPEARIGNVLSRPHIRKYELLYLATSDLPQKQLIYLSDLTLSIRQGRLIIRSKRLKKEIIPRLTTAHNYHNSSIPVYRFLCDMQIPLGRNALGFNWGALFNEFSFLPRVKYKNTILSSAIWFVKNEDIKHLFDIKIGDTLPLEFEEWRKSRNIPRRVLMLDGDNELFVDWQSTLSIRSLFSIIKTRPTVRFEEFLFDEKKAVVKDRKGVYTNECIVAFYKDKK